MPVTAAKVCKPERKPLNLGGGFVSPDQAKRLILEDEVVPPGPPFPYCFRCARRGEILVPQRWRPCSPEADSRLWGWRLSHAGHPPLKPASPSDVLVARDDIARVAWRSGGRL